MRTSLASLFIITILLTACGTPAAAPATQPQATSTQTATMAPSATPTPTASPTTAPTATPTPTAIPTDFRSDNFNQFVQIQTYRASIEKAVGEDITAMRLDAIAYSLDGRYVAVGGCTGIWEGNCISDVYGGNSFLFFPNLAMSYTSGYTIATLILIPPNF